jgi:hypothetical protein
VLRVFPIYRHARLKITGREDLFVRLFVCLFVCLYICYTKLWVCCLGIWEKLSRCGPVDQSKRLVIFVVAESLLKSITMILFLPYPDNSKSIYLACKCMRSWFLGRSRFSARLSITAASSPGLFRRRCNTTTWTGMKGDWKDGARFDYFPFCWM